MRVTAGEDAPHAGDRSVAQDLGVLETGAVSPQPGSVDDVPAAQLPPTFIPATPHPRLWVMGVHGGAGESTVSRLLREPATEGRWPQYGSAPVLLVARTHVHGLLRLQEVATAWAAGQLPTGTVVGALLVADAPGRMPRPLRDLAQVVAGGVPHLWRLEWSEEMRTHDPADDTLPPGVGGGVVRKIRREIDRVLAR
ncbi:hypothetical protein GCM10027425_33550 [Alteromonas gracilis]